MITYKLKINFQEPRILNSDMEFVTGDVGAYRLEFEFYDNGKRADLAGKLLTVRARRADGVCFSASGDIADNIGVFMPKNNLYSVPGELYLEIALTDNAGNYVTAKILTAAVIDGIGDVPNGAQDDVSIYVTLLAQTKTLIDEANKLVENAKISFEEQLGETNETILSHTGNKSNPHSVTKAQVGLSNVDNTSDLDKPVSTAMQSALNAKANSADVYTKLEINNDYTDNYGLGILLDEKADVIDVAEDILNAQKHILQLLSGRLLYKGEVASFQNLPTGLENCDVYRLKTGCTFSNDPHSELITGNFSDLFSDTQLSDTPYYVFNEYNSYSSYFTEGADGDYYAQVYNQYGKYVCSIWHGDGYPNGLDKSILMPIMTGEDTVAFYLSPVQTTFYTVSDLGLVFNYNFKWYPLSDAGWIKQEIGDIEAALDGILSIQNTLIGGGSE